VTPPKPGQNNAAASSSSVVVPLAIAGGLTLAAILALVWAHKHGDKKRLAA
jgi:hypothetical protein